MLRIIKNRFHHHRFTLNNIQWKSPCDYAKSERGSQYSILRVQCRAVRRSENPEVPVLFGGHNLPPLVEIGLTDLPKSGGAMGPPAPPRDDTPAMQHGSTILVVHGSAGQTVHNPKRREISCWGATKSRWSCSWRLYIYYTPLTAADVHTSHTQRKWKDYRRVNRDKEAQNRNIQNNSSSTLGLQHTTKARL